MQAATQSVPAEVIQFSAECVMRWAYGFRNNCLILIVGFKLNFDYCDFLGIDTLSNNVVVSGTRIVM